MVRLCFNRKNKTLRSVFTTKSVLSMLDENYRTYQSLAKGGLAPSVQESKLEMDTFMDDAADGFGGGLGGGWGGDVEMKDEGAEDSSSKSEIKQLVETTLKNSGYLDARASKMSIDDFLR